MKASSIAYRYVGGGLGEVSEIANRRVNSFHPVRYAPAQSQPNLIPVIDCIKSSRRQNRINRNGTAPSFAAQCL
jgi:hypothetical protein